MNVIIDGIDFWDMEAMKYYAPPKSHSAERKREDAKACIFSETWIGSRKYDGIWAMIIKDMNGKFYLRSRTKNVQNTFNNKEAWIPHIIKELDCIPNGTVLLGEIYKKGDEGSRKTTAILNCLLDKSLERQKTNPLSFCCFDILAYNGKNIMSKPIGERISHYLDYELVDILKGNYVSAATYYRGEELWNVLGEILAEGHEGMVIQREDTPYQPGKCPRSTLKIKQEIANTIDAFLDGDYKQPTRDYSGKTPLEEYPYWMNVKTGEKVSMCMWRAAHNGEPWIPITRLYYLNYAGSLSFSVMKDGKPVHIGYISGLPDEIRKGIIDNPDKWVHRVFEISCMQLENIDGAYSMRHAKVLQERKDKNWQECDWRQISEN